MLSPVRVSAPASTPVSLDEAKQHLRVDHTDDDLLITALIEAATDHLDGYSGILGRALVTQTWRADFPVFPACGFIRLPLVPVQSITSVAYSDGSNADQVFASAGYALQADALGSAVYLGSGYSWPSVYSRADAVRVTFIAGYPATDWADASKPGMAAIKAAILLTVGELYANREASVPSNIQINPTVAALIAPLRRYSI